MSGVAERSRTALQTFKKIVHELNQAHGKINNKSPQFRFLVDQFRNHQVTQRISCPNEAEHLAQTYLTYLESSRKLAELHKKYQSKQRTVEESANLVGLKVPKQTRFD